MEITWMVNISSGSRSTIHTVFVPSLSDNSLCEVDIMFEHVLYHLLCTVTFHMAVRTTLVVSAVAWQVYSPPWDVRRGLNVRTPALTVIPSPVVTSLPLEYCHWMDGVPGTSTLQVSVYICPAVDMPESVMVTLNGSSRKERIHVSACTR